MYWNGNHHRLPEFYEYCGCYGAYAQYRAAAAVCKLWPYFSVEFIHWYGVCIKRQTAGSTKIQLGEREFQ